MTGFFYEIVKEALNRMDISTSWETYPWARCQANVENGTADAMITVPTKKRLKYTCTHESPIYLKKLRIFTYKNHPNLAQIRRIKTFNDIKTLNLSVITYSTNGWNNTYITSLGVRTYDTSVLENVWAMLANRRGDIVIEWPVAAWPDIRAAKAESDIIITEATLDAMPFHLMIRKDSPAAKRLPDFNKTIQEMRKDGTTEAILRKYTQPVP